MNRIDEEAAGWAVRLQSRPLSSDEQSDLDAWLAADPRHQGALVRARAAQVGLERFAALAAGRHMGSGQARTFNRRWLIAASISAVAVAGTASWIVLRSSGTRYASGLGEQRSVPLADGSMMLLNTSSEASVRFDERRREVRLHSGEALFEVAKDPTRPFLVRTDRLVVRAVGTAFAVRIDDDEHVNVTVTEGVVEVSNDIGAEGAAVQRVVANEQAIAVPARPFIVQPIPQEVAERRLAWRNGMVALDGESLSEAIAEMNRHGRRSIVIDDATLGSRPVVGIFRATDTENFAQMAATALHAEVVDEGSVIRLRPTQVH